MVKAQHEYVSPMSLALVHIGMGNKSLAMEDLERGVEEHSYNAMYLGLEPAFLPLREEPRFQKLLRHVHLP